MFFIISRKPCQTCQNLYGKKVAHKWTIDSVHPTWEDANSFYPSPEFWDTQPTLVEERDLSDYGITSIKMSWA